MHLYQDYKDPQAKITRMLRDGQLIHLKRGFYVNATALENGLAHGKIANALYGPSYVSFEYALRIYNLIPESVRNIGSVTWGKRRGKVFHTAICSFSYRDIPEKVFPLGQVFHGQGSARFLMASPEKALCDMAYIRPAIRTLASMRAFLEEDLRIDMGGLRSLDPAALGVIVNAYPSTSVDTLGRFLERWRHE